MIDRNHPYERWIYDNEIPYRNMIVHRPRKVTRTPSGTEISSVHYDDNNGSRTLHLDETCVFFPNGQSKIVGSYDDHEAMVKKYG